MTSLEISDQYVINHNIFVILLSDVCLLDCWHLRQSLPSLSSIAQSENMVRNPWSHSKRRILCEQVQRVSISCLWESLAGSNYSNWCLIVLSLIGEHYAWTDWSWTSIVCWLWSLMVSQQVHRVQQMIITTLCYAKCHRCSKRDLAW